MPKPPTAKKRSFQNELALLLSARHRRLGQISDAYEALEQFQSILNTAKADDPIRCKFLTYIACTYDDLYRSTAKIEHLEEAYKLSMEAIACSDVKTYPNMWLNGANRCIRFYITNDHQVRYLSQDIKLIHQGLGIAQKWRLDGWLQMCLSARIIYGLRHRKFHEAEDLSSALVMYLETWHLKIATLQKRLRVIDLACNLLIEKAVGRKHSRFLRKLSS